MTYEEMIAAIESVNQNVPRMATPHGSNLLHQLNKRQAGKEALYESIINRYLAIRNVPYEDNLLEYINAVVEKTDEYMDFFWPPTNNPFSHQADFTSSIIPEMLCTIFRKVIGNEESMEVSAQKDLTIECVFDISGGERISFKNKRVDVAVVKLCQLALNDHAVEFPIPLVAIECKTNLDKNMLSGIEHSVNELKKTFPNCRYYVTTEYSDFDVKKSNYAASGIDEMYIFRKQKRAIIRRNPDSKNPIDSQLVFEIAQVLQAILYEMRSPLPALSERMENGKLIGV